MNKLKSLDSAKILKVERYDSGRQGSCQLTNESVQKSFREHNPYNNGSGKEYSFNMKNEEVKNYYEIKNNLKLKLRKSNYNGFN